MRVEIEVGRLMSPEMHRALRERLHALLLDAAFEGESIDMLRNIRSEASEALRVSVDRRAVIGRRIAEVEAKLRPARIEPRDTSAGNAARKTSPAFPAVNRVPA